MGRQIRNLGQAAKYGMLVCVECTRCNRKADFYGGSLCGMYGWQTTFDQLPFKCGACGRKPDRVYPHHLEKHELKGRLVWRLVRED